MGDWIRGREKVLHNLEKFALKYVGAVNPRKLLLT